jgi:transposase
MEATGYSRWLERLLAELGFEVWMGDQGQADQEAEDRAQRCPTPTQADAGK